MPKKIYSSTEGGGKSLLADYLRLNPPLLSEADKRFLKDEADFRRRNG